MHRRLTAAAVAATLALGLVVTVAPAATAIDAPTPSLAELDDDGDLRLSWQPEPGATGYTVEVATSPAFAGTTLTTAQTTNPTWVPPVPFVSAVPQMLFWRVAAHTSGTTPASRGDFSAAEQVVVPASPVPALTSPDDAGTITYPSAVAFRWAPVPGAASYTLEYSSNETFPADASVTTTVTTTATSHVPAAPLVRTSGGVPITWHWRVRANFWAGSSTTTPTPGATSEVRTFRVEWPATASAPQLLSPAAWSPGVPAVSDVRFTWAPVDGAASYTVVVGVSLDETGTLVSGQVAGAGGTTTGTSLVPAVALLDQNYWWQVIAYDTAGNPGAPSEVRELRRAWGPQTGPVAETDQPITFPVAHEGSTSIDTAPEVPLDQLELSWDPVVRATLYEVEVYPTNGNPVLTCRTASTSATVIQASVEGNQTGGALNGDGPCLWHSDITKRIKPGETYRWRVRAIDFAGSSATGLQATLPAGTLASAWSDPFTGNVERRRFVSVTAPTPTAATSPVPDEPAWDLQTTSALLGQPSPVFAWSPVAGADGYEVVVALNEDMTNEVAIVRTPSARLRLNGVLDNNSTGLPYYWRVRPFTADPSWTIRTYISDASSVAPSWRRIARPSDFTGAAPVTTDPDGTVTLAWRPQSASAPLDGGSRGYLLSIFSGAGNLIGSVKLEYPFFVAAHPTTGLPLAPGDYRFSVAALDANGKAGTLTAQQVFVIGAPRPTAGTAEVSASSALLPWTTTAAAAKFEGQYWNAATPGTRISFSATTKQEAFTLADLPAGTYGWHVRSVDTATNVSPWSAPGTFTIETRQPQLSTPGGAVLSTVGRVLDWEPVPGASRYLVQVSTTAGGLDAAIPVETTATAFAPTVEMSYGPVYHWRVKAVPDTYQPTGSTTRPVLGVSEARTFSTRTVPGVPTVAAPANSGADLAVTWTPLAAQARGTDAPLRYVVRYRAKAVPENPWTTLAPTSADAASVLLTSLPSSTTFQVEVAALSPEGQGPWSTTQEKATPTVPTVPTSVSVASGASSLTLGWRAPSAPTGVPVTGFVIRYRPTGTDTWTVVEVGAALTAYGITGLDPEAQYDLEIAAVNAVGVGPSATATATTYGAPSAPQTVKAVAADRSTTVSWTPPAGTGGTPINAYEVQIRAYSAASKTWGAWTTRTTVPASTLQTNLTGLTNGATYQVQVRAKNTVATGATSTPVTVVPAAKPAAPGSVKATATVGKTKISWTKPATNGSVLKGYVVQYSTNASTWTTMVTKTTAYTSHTWTGGTRGKTYYFRVYATSSMGNSPYSSIVYAKRL